MAMLDKKGRYFAYPEAWAMKVEENKCPRFAITFKIISTTDGEAVDGDQRITGFFTLVNKDGSANEINLTALRDALGWDGQSFSSLESSDWSKTEVQIVVDTHEYNGKVSLEVKYINPKDYVGGISKADPQAVQSLDVKYGSMLRAVFKKNGASSKAATKPIAIASSIDAAKQSAWSVYVDKAPSTDKDRQIEVFKGLIAEAFPGLEPKDMTEPDWVKLKSDIQSRFSAATGTLLPF